MISFSQLGNMGRLGNQLFQYAFLRSTATKLGVKYWCPQWEGDTIFDLNDTHFRLSNRPELVSWHAPATECGWIENWEPKDNVDYVGYFGSPKFLLPQDSIQQWFRFREDTLEAAHKKYSNISFRNCISAHVRLGDHVSLPNFYNPRRLYYERSFQTIDPDQGMTILLFSDNPEGASDLLKGQKRHILIMNDNSPAVDLYLMTQCAGNVVAASTFSWWGAYLGSGVVTCPIEGLLRPGSTINQRAPWPEQWIRMSGGVRLFDHAIFIRCQQKIRNTLGTLKRTVFGRKLNR